MKRKNFKQIFAVLLSLVMIVAFANLALAAEKEQFGSVEGTKVAPEPETAPVKRNICKNPKLCESLEIDLMNNLQKAKISASLPGLQATTATQEDKVALNLGVVVADALGVILNKDKAAFLKCVGMVNDYAKKLGTPQPVINKYSNLAEAANKGEWDKLGCMIYNYKDEIIAGLCGKSEDDANLSMVSGALEGLFILAKSVDNQFSPESAELLRNKDVIQVLNSYTLSEGAKAKADVKAIFAALPQLYKIIDKPKDYKYTQGDAKEILKIYEPLRKSIIS